MEFLDINLTKGSSLLLHAILKEIIFFSGFKNPHKKIRETKQLEPIHEWHFVEQENEGRKPDKKSSLLRLECMPRKLDTDPDPKPCKPSIRGM
jgi:hypothetical protein